MAVPEYTKRSIKKYNKKTYKVITVRFTNGCDDEVRERAKEEGVSINEFILTDLKEKINGR